MFLNHEAMKTKITILTTLLFFVMFSSHAQTKQATNAPAGSSALIQVSCTPDVLPLATAWVGEYGRLNPAVRIHLSKVSPEVFPGKGHQICLFSDQYLPENKLSDDFRVVVAREIVVPVINKNNPLNAKIRQQGISAEKLSAGIGEDGHASWKSLAGGNSELPVHFYMMEDGFTVAKVASFLKTGKDNLKNFTLIPASVFTETISSDPLALGFCRLSTVLDPKAGNLEGNVQILPLDKNGNGKLEFMENIYDDLTDFTRGVWIGKYPKSLTDHVFLSMAHQPEGAAEVAFIEWILTDGQDNIPLLGYSPLVSAERNTQMDKLVIPPSDLAKVEQPESLTKMILMIIAGIVVIAIVAAWIYRKVMAGINTGSPSADIRHHSLDQAQIDIPGGLFYDKTHTWAFMEKSGLVKVGMDDFLQHVTGAITKIELKKPGDYIRKGDHLCTVMQNGKQLNLCAPVSGEIKAANPALSANGAIINESPYFGGWIYQVEPANWLREIRFLFMANKYREWIESEFTRIKDFLAVCGGRNTLSLVAFQDGGLLCDHVLEDMGPEVWEEFQRNFLDSAK